jgi:hypothetical protein
LANERTRLTVEREGLIKLAIRGAGERIVFHFWFHAEGIGGELAIDVGGSVRVRDTLLRQ